MQSMDRFCSMALNSIPGSHPITWCDGRERQTVQVSSRGRLKGEGRAEGKQNNTRINQWLGDCLAEIAESLTGSLFHFITS